MLKETTLFYFVWYALKFANFYLSLLLIASKTHLKFSHSLTVLRTS